MIGDTCPGEELATSRLPRAAWAPWNTRSAAAIRVGRREVGAPCVGPDGLPDLPPRRRLNAMASEHSDPSGTLPPVPGSVTQQRLRVASRAVSSLLLGGAAVLGSMIAFRQGLLPLIDALFHPGPESLSAFRRTGIVLSGLAGYWVYVRWYEKRAATELRLRPAALVLGAASGAGLVALPIAVLFALGAYEMILFRGASPALLGVAVLIGIAALLEELVYRCVLFQVLERVWGTAAALALQAVIFAVAHFENVENGDVGDAVMMVASVTLLGLLWGGVFVLFRNVWVPAANHAAWNFTILLSGVPLSGIEDWRALAPIESRYAGPDWLTGGMVGPESSALVMVSMAVAVVLVLRAARRRQALLPRAI